MVIGDRVPRRGTTRINAPHKLSGQCPRVRTKQPHCPPNGACSNTVPLVGLAKRTDALTVRTGPFGPMGDTSPERSINFSPLIPDGRRDPGCCEPRSPPLPCVVTAV